MKKKNKYQINDEDKKKKRIIKWFQEPEYDQELI